MDEYLKVCASDKFAKYIASPSPFRSLDHAINVAKDIFLNKLDVGSWLEALSHRYCFNTYIATTTESTKQELYEWGFEYQRKFGYAFVTYASGKSSDEIISEMKVNSLGTDHATEFDTNNNPRENVRGVDGKQSKADGHVRPEKGFDLNKLPW
ncbi:hypothetical protein PIB30_045076 [Stylosanthes scabra]|uniref:2-oxo-4-hydroxy-4-carboxy-5-ureidoimidazoline decarboxylase n=1 Tax=Stylosanthes scabra TaxID=79078 RepID=A0ABU6WJF8_9FABA|nr:hypothetical protein [Stylosanthes scabra]